VKKKRTRSLKPPRKPEDFIAVSDEALGRIAADPDNGCAMEEASIAYELWYARRQIELLQAWRARVMGELL
jgi:hypothetical protein